MTLAVIIDAFFNILVVLLVQPRVRMQELQSVPEDRAIDFPLSKAANIPVSDAPQEVC